jgi:hypothetical protein
MIRRSCIRMIGTFPPIIVRREKWQIVMICLVFCILYQHPLWMICTGSPSKLCACERTRLEMLGRASKAACAARDRASSFPISDSSGYDKGPVWLVSGFFLRHVLSDGKGANVGPASASSLDFHSSLYERDCAREKGRRRRAIDSAFLPYG